jgi:hypothetical protein
MLDNDVKVMYLREGEDAEVETGDELSYGKSLPEVISI